MLDPNLDEALGIEPDDTKTPPQNDIADFMLHSRLAGHSWSEIHALLSRIPDYPKTPDLADRLNRMATQNLGSNNG
jgi:hypothetical protein